MTHDKTRKCYLVRPHGSEKWQIAILTVETVRDGDRNGDTAVMWACRDGGAIICDANSGERINHLPE